MFFKSQHSKSYHKLSDSELIEIYKQKGDNRIIGELFNRYGHLVFGIACKFFASEDDRRDVVMDVFAKLYDDLKEHQIHNFKCWLYSVAKNHCLMLLRKEKNIVFNEQFPLKNFQQDFMDFLPSLSLINAHDEILDKKLPEAIQKLNDEQKTCIELFYLQDKSYKEIADITKYSLNQVKSHIQNGKRNLKLMLENKK